MTITTYHVTSQSGRSDTDANATIHLINDLAFSSGENRSWDATRALVNSMLDAATQERLGIQIEAEELEADTDD
jgi:hypothetical protein